MKQLHTVGSMALALVSVLGITYAAGPTFVNLGNASNFSVLAGSAITNIGSSVINGDIGISPGTAITGFPPAVLNGTQNVANPTAVQAKTDLTNSYIDASGRTPVSRIGTELGGTTQLPGVYDSANGTFGITGTLTLNALGDPNAVFIFKSASTLITASASNIVLAGGAQACNVFWIVGSSATLGTNSTLEGSIIAQTSVTLTTGAHVDGRVLAINGAVTLDSSTINRATCVSPVLPVVPVIVVATTTPVVIATTTVVPVIVVATTTPVVIATTTVVTVIPTVTPTAVTPSFPNTGYAPEQDYFFLDNFINMIRNISAWFR